MLAKRGDASGVAEKWQVIDERMRYAVGYAQPKSEQPSVARHWDG